MAGLMQWFQVTCPNCTAALQVRLPEGVTSVQCSQCKAVFAVQVQPIALNTSGQAPLAKRSRKRKTGDKAGLGSEAPARTLSAYNVFMKCEVAKVKGERPELPHREAFKMVTRPAPVTVAPRATPSTPARGAAAGGGAMAVFAHESAEWWRALSTQAADDAADGDG